MNSKYEVCFVYRSNGGLGSICVQALSQTGSWTVLAAGTNQAALEELASLPHVIPVKMDITDQISIDAAFAAIQGHTDRLDAIVNFAGLSCFSSLIEGESVNAIERLLRVNVMGMSRVNKNFFPMVLKARGRIINCSSESGWMTPQPFAGPYVLSKYAVEAYNDCLRRELLYLNIPVIKIQPGAYQTPMTRQLDIQFEKAVSETSYYKKLLVKMKPMMIMELQQNNDPQRLVKTVIHAMEAKHPRRYYRVGTGRMLSLLELLPEGGVDGIYKIFFSRVK